MKNHLLILVFSLFSIVSFGQTKSSVIKMISNSQFDQLTSLMDDEVELILIDDADFYSSGKAIQKLKSALTDIGPGTWKEKHIGGTKGGMSTYSVGILSAKGGNYRLYIVKEKSGGGQKIVSIELERL